MMHFSSLNVRETIKILPESPDNSTQNALITTIKTVYSLATCNHKMLRTYDDKLDEYEACMNKSVELKCYLIVNKKIL